MGKFGVVWALMLVAVALTGTVWGQVPNENRPFDFGDGHVRDNRFNSGRGTQRAQVEVYALGAGGGGQGAARNSSSSNRTIRTGGSGGGGAVAYMRFNVTGEATLQINVGRGGDGGSDRNCSNCRGGEPGRYGGESRVDWGSSHIIARGGGGGGWYDWDYRRGGDGGTATIHNAGGILDFRSAPGHAGATIGSEGCQQHSGGNPGIIGIGHVNPFTGGLGAFIWCTGNSNDHDRAAGLGGGGTGGWGQDVWGWHGGHGQVRIIVTHFHTVTFNSNGGSAVNPRDTLNGVAISQPANPTRTGYTFAGWWTAQTGGSQWNFTSNTVTANTTLFARWTPVTYSITYNSNSGTSFSSTSFTVESPTITLPTPTRLNYTFSGWFENANFTGNSITSVPTGSRTANFQVHAKWTPLPFAQDGFYSSSTGQVGLSWRYSNEPSNMSGRFFIYRRQTEPAPLSGWSLLTASGLRADNGINRDIVWNDAGVTYGTTYEYLIVFVEDGRTQPNAATLTLPVNYSASLEVKAEIGEHDGVPRPILLTWMFNHRTETSGANRQVILNWKYDNQNNMPGKFFVYRSEAPDNETPLTPSGIDAAASAERLSMAYADTSIAFNNEYEYRIVFVPQHVPTSTEGRVPAVSTHLLNVTPGTNATAPFNQVNHSKVVDGVTYKDIYGTAPRSLRNNDVELFKHLLNGVQVPGDGNYTHLARWMDISRLVAPLHENVKNILDWSRNVLNTRKGSRPNAFAATTMGSLEGTQSIALAAEAMRNEFNSRSGYAISGANTAVAIPDGLAALDEITTPVFWVLDRRLVHANNVDDDRNAGSADYAHYGMGLIFYDLKLSYIETGEPFSTADFEGVFDDNSSGTLGGFRYNFKSSMNPAVSGVRNESIVTGNYTQTWRTFNHFTLGNEVSDLVGYELSETRGNSSSISVSVEDRTLQTHTADIENTLKLSKGFVSNTTKASYKYHREDETTTTNSTTNTNQYEFKTSDIFQHTDSRSSSQTIGEEQEYSVSVPLPPHTQVMLRQGWSSIEAHIDFDYPVTISYKVMVVALGEQRIGGTTTSFMRPIATYGIDKTPENRVSASEIDAAENFRVLWGFRSSRTNTGFHSADTISLINMWPQMKQTIGNVSNFDLLGFDSDFRFLTDAALTNRLIRPVTEDMTNEKPMTVIRATMSHEFESMNSTISGFQPLHELHRIEAPELSAINLKGGEQYHIDRIELTGRNRFGVEFHGFHKDKGYWVLVDANGSLHDGSIAWLTEEIGTGRPVIVTNNDVTGTVFLRYRIADGVYAPADLNRYMTWQELEQGNLRTVSIPVNVTGLAPTIITMQPTDKAVKFGETAEFTASAEFTDPDLLTWQWQVSTNNGVFFSNLSNGTDAASASYTTPAASMAMNGYIYRCIVTDDLGRSDTSNIATLRVNKALPAADLLTFNLSNAIYNGNQRSISVTPAQNVTGLGMITVRYNGLSTVPVNAGTYAVTVDIADGTNYTAAQILLGDFTVDKGTREFVTVTARNAVYTSWLTLEDVALPRGYRWITPQTELLAGNGQTFDAIFAGDNNWNDANGTVRVNVAPAVSILSPNRLVPPTKPDTNGKNTASVNQLTSEFTAGPNPVNKQSDAVNFFWQGKWIQSATLTIFDASGNVVNWIKIKDNKDGKDADNRRQLGSWNLTDRKGRSVTEGTYLVRGVVITSDGKRERVSVMLGIR